MNNIWRWVVNKASAYFCGAVIGVYLVIITAQIYHKPVTMAEAGIIFLLTFVGACFVDIVYRLWRLQRKAV